MKRFATSSAWKAARKSRIKEEQLVEVSNKTNAGLVDAKLGARIYKQRLGRKGDFRTIIYLVKDRRSLILHIYPKNEQANITSDELKTLREFADILNGLSDEDFVKAARERGWKELSDEGTEEGIQKRPPAVDP